MSAERVRVVIVAGIMISVAGVLGILQSGQGTRAAVIVGACGLVLTVIAVVLARAVTKAAGSHRD